MRLSKFFLVLLFPALLAPAAVPAGAVPVTADCHVPLPLSELQVMLDENGRDPETGEQIPVQADGLTVVHGTTRQTFTAEILAIDYGGAGIDHDIVIAELSGLGIDGSRGVWAGMSGSPVYVGEQLVGAVAYGYTWGPSSLAGITPAEEMLTLTDAGAATSEASAQAPAQAITLDAEERQAIAAQTGRSAAAVPSRIPRLQVPLAISGSAERIAWLQREAGEDRARLSPVAGSGFRATAAAEGDIVAGSNFAATLSHGDVTIAGVGTTTWTCNGESLAFGHPFFWDGETEMGLHAASAVTVATDPAFGSYKLATIGAPAGTIDQDRYTGLHGVAGAGAATPVTSFTVAERPDGSFRSDSGKTGVAATDYVPFVTFIHGFANIDFLLDRYYSDGSSTITWTVDLQHKGRSYRLERTNQYNSRYDVSIESMIEPWQQLEELAHNRFGEVKFRKVALRSDAVDVQRYFQVRAAQVRRNGRWFTPERALRVEPGETLAVRAILDRYEGSRRTATRRTEFSVNVPRSAGDSSGRIRFGRAAGGGGDFCFLYGECGGGGQRDESFAALLRRLRNAPRNDELAAELTVFADRVIRRTQTTMLPKVVVGSKSLRLRIGAGGSGGGEATEPAREG